MTLEQIQPVETLMAGALRDMERHQAQVALGEAEPYIVDHDGYFTSLPQEYYVSPEIFEKDIRKVFNKQWLYAGQMSQLKKTGDYYVRDIGQESLIISRTEDGLRALFNVCRHRGSRICGADEVGTAKSFSCPYHRWTYGSDGALKSVPGAKNGEFFNFKDWSLEEAHIDSYHGAIFVYLDKDGPAQSLYQYLRPGSCDPKILEAIETERTKLAARKVYDVPVNWKTMLENNSECYHCPGSHPSLCATVNVQANWLEADGTHEALPEDGASFSIKPDLKTMSASGDWLVKKPLGTPQPAGFNAGLAVMPCFAAMLWTADYGIVISVEPVAVDQTRLICEWLVHEDAVEGEDYDLPTLMKMWDTTNLEDIELATNNYKGTKSMRYSPGPNIVRREGLIRKSLVSYLDLFNAPDTEGDQRS